mmetsp:Transcript_146219/g.468957  ORF Transcript_146219/g.468957 Transcript_146219/m.468957 type:complete len:219 (+) Transcript_146219:496-1152(+)
MALYEDIVGLEQLCSGTLQTFDLPNEKFDRSLLRVQAQKFPHAEAEDRDVFHARDEADALPELQRQHDTEDDAEASDGLLHVLQYPDGESLEVDCELVHGPVGQDTDREHDDHEREVEQGPVEDVELGVDPTREASTASVLQLAADAWGTPKENDERADCDDDPILVLHGDVQPERPAAVVHKATPNVHSLCLICHPSNGKLFLAPHSRLGTQDATSP